MKVIFLDVDGVLNFKGCEEVLSDGTYFLSEEKLQLLSRMLKETDGYLILCSTWKRGWRDSDHNNTKSLAAEKYYMLCAKLNEYGMSLYGKTPDLRDLGREKEIEYWLSSWTGEPVESFVILDDNEENYTRLRSRLILTSIKEGLQEEHIEEAKELLKDESCMKLYR